MASHIWIGGAPAVAQVESVTFPDDVEAGQIISFALGVRTFSVTLTGTTRDLIIAEVASAWNNSTIPEVAEISAVAVVDDDSNLTGVMKLTARTAGKPFAVTVSIGSGNNEVQVITLSGTAATGGTFTLTFDGQTTGNIAYNASAATVDAALEALSNIGAGDVTVTGTGPWTVEFTGALAGTNVALMTIETTNLTGGVNEIQTISSPSSPTGGTFTLSFGGEATAPIAYNASAATIEAALELLTTIPTDSVSCAGGALPGTPVTVTFQDEFASRDVALLVADSSSLTGVTGSAAEITAGGSTIKDATEHFWNFETQASGGKFTDSVGSTILDEPNAGVLTHGANGVIGNGVHYPGGTSSSSNYLLGSSGEHTKAGTEDFSVSAWVKFDNATAGLGRIIMAASSSSFVNYHLKMNHDNTFTFAISGTTYTVTSVATATINIWAHVVGVYDSVNNLVKISVDGAAFVTAATSTTFSEPSSTYLKVGGGSHSGLSSYESWEGYIDAVGIYSSALTIGQVGDLYNSGVGDEYPFLSAGNNEVQTLTLTGSPTAGSVTVSYQGVGVDIPYDATASEAEVLLDTISTIGSGNVNVTGGPWPGTALVVEFINDLAVTDVELLDMDTSALVMLVTETTKGVTAPVGSVATTVTPLTQTETTASEGPNDWSIAANWNSNTVPVTSDTVYISDTDVSILYGLDQSAVTLAALHVEQTFTGFIGLPRTNSDGTNSYFEYRDQYLKIRATLINIGDKEGDGSDRIKIDLGSVQSTVLITDSGTGEDANTPAILLLGTHASNVIDINRGSLGVAYYPTEVSTIATLRQAFFDDAASDTTVFLGAGVTITDIIKTGGDLDINSATTTFRQDAGETTIHAGAHAALDVNDGTLNYNSTGTATAISLAGDAVLNFNQDRRPKAVTAITKKSEGSEIFDDSGCISAPVIVMQDIKNFEQLHFASNYTVTLT
ncbi:MAG: hypothetical protein K0U86_11730 [Planctomycetes bacterium]|nr:hypothetical protein [Planctomycetota bacterium]